MPRPLIPTTLLLAASFTLLPAQQPNRPQRGPGGPGGPPAPNREERKIFDQFDQDENKYLDPEERTAARTFLKENPAPESNRPGRRRPPTDNTPPKPGAKISPKDVPPTTSRDLYDTDTLRTLFLNFDSDDWEAELEAFRHTDVEVPATMVTDGKTLEHVGVSFRGASSYFRVPAGRKRSFNISIDAVHDDQRLDGYKTLNLLNCNGDGAFLSAVLYSDIARKYIPAPKANHVRVVVNGENWGIYVSQQQYNKEFLQENYRTSNGARWKVPGSPRGQGGLDYIGDNIEDYRKHYDIKSKDKEEDWNALIALCKVLTESPLEELEEALEPHLDIDNALWFLALDCALINSDGYWTRASDYNLYRGTDGRFRLIPHDMNEAFRPARRRGGPSGGGRPPQGDRPPERADDTPNNGLHLDPLIAMDDPKKPLRSRLLAVPALRERYLEKVRHIAEHDLDWKSLGPKVAAYRSLIGEELAADTRKMTTTEQFNQLTADSPGKADPNERSIPLRIFADERRKFLLNHKAK